MSFKKHVSFCNLTRWLFFILHNQFSFQFIIQAKFHFTFAYSKTNKIYKSIHYDCFRFSFLVVLVKIIMHDTLPIQITMQSCLFLPIYVTSQAKTFLRWNCLQYRYTVKFCKVFLLFTDKVLELWTRKLFVHKV